MTVKDTIASCLIIALGAILALHFALFWVYGGVFIHESNKVILTIETVMSAAIIGFGLERLANSARSNRLHQATPSNPSSRDQSIPTLASSRQAPGSRATSAGYAATAVAAASSLLFSSDSSSADSRTHGTCDPTEGGSGVLIRLTQMEREPTVDTGSTVSSSPVLSR